MSHNVQCTYLPGLTLFSGALFLEYLEKFVLTDTQFADVTVQAAVTAGKLVEITQQDATDIFGDYPVTNEDRILEESSNWSVDTSMGGVRLTLFPNPVEGSGVTHIFTPATFTWEAHNVELVASYPIAGHDEPYFLDVSVAVMATFLGAAVGWRINPLS